MAARVDDDPCIRMTAAPFVPGTYQPASRVPSRAGNVTSCAPATPIEPAERTGAWGTLVAYAPTVTGMTTTSIASRLTTMTSTRAGQRRPASWSAMASRRSTMPAASASRPV